MKINNIGNNYYINFKAAENKPKTKKQITKTEKIVYGLTGAAALGVAAYFIFRRPKSVNVVKPKPETATAPLTSKPPAAEPKLTAQQGAKPFNIDDFVPFFNDKTDVVKSKFKNGTAVTYKKIDGDKTYRDILVLDNDNKLMRRITDYKRKDGQMWSRVYKGLESQILIHPDKFPKGRYDSDYLVKEFSGEARKPFGLKGDQTERLTRVAFPDGNSKTYQGFFNKNNKLHEYTIYHDKFDNSLGCFDRLHQAQSEYIVNYNYAYKDGKRAGIAKQDRLKDNNWHGVYQHNGFNAFPQFIDLKDGKGFNEFKGDLYIRHPEFDPEKF